MNSSCIGITTVNRALERGHFGACGLAPRRPGTETGERIIKRTALSTNLSFGLLICRLNPKISRWIENWCFWPILDKSDRHFAQMIWLKNHRKAWKNRQNGENTLISIFYFLSYTQFHPKCFVKRFTKPLSLSIGWYKSGYVGGFSKSRFIFPQLRRSVGQSWTVSREARPSRGFPCSGMKSLFVIVVHHQTQQGREENNLHL